MAAQRSPVAMTRYAWPQVIAAIGVAALESSLALPWYSGIGDSGHYSYSGWSGLVWLDVVISLAAANAAVALIAALAVLGDKRAYARTTRSYAGGVVLVVGALGIVVAVAKGLLGHADGDPTAATPEVGVFLALAGSLLLVVGGAALGGARALSRLARLRVTPPKRARPPSALGDRQ